MLVSVFTIHRRRPLSTPSLERVYMYTPYERFWHWLQTFTVIVICSSPG